MNLSENTIKELKELLEGFEVSAVVEQGVYDDLEVFRLQFNNGDNSERTMRYVRVALEAKDQARNSIKSANALKEVLGNIK